LAPEVGEMSRITGHLMRRAIFVVYLAMILGGLAYFITIGLLRL
jgi:hypothetical protein